MASFLDGALAEAFRLATDGSAVDPVAFQEALRADPAKLAAIEADEELRDVVLGQDTTALQALLRTIFQDEQGKLEKRKARMAERSIDAQRASATVPRDTVQLYASLREAGLEYGPAFRLLRNVHVPDTA